MSEYKGAGTTNRIYVYGGGTMTMAGLLSTLNMPEGTIVRDGSVWLLNANILVEDDTELLISNADLTELRLKSMPSSDPANDNINFVRITAGNFDAGRPTSGAGKVTISGVKVTSWNGSGPDTNYEDGRAYINARSRLFNSVAESSRLDVLNSEIAYLGWNDSESYGLSWKSPDEGVPVLGDVKDSNIHHNLYGIYSFRLRAPQWLRNNVHDNHGYGIDGHDDTDDAIIDGNTVTNNGHSSPATKPALHGIIMSERCDGVQVTNNTSSGNAGNGIMMHDLSDNAVITGNTANNNGDAGIAIFCSSGSQVANNTLTGNTKYGMRFTVAANNNTVANNTVSGSGEYGIFIQPASDSNGICGSDLRPQGNVFTGNTVSGSVTSGLKITDGHNNTFTGNTFNDGVSIRNSISATEQVVNFSQNTFGSGTVVRLDGGLTLPLRGNFTDTAHVSMHVDDGVVASFTDDAGAIFDVSTRDLMTNVNGSATSLDLTADNAGTDFVVDTRPLLVTMGGTTGGVAPTQWETSGEYRKGWIARADNASATVNYSVGDLQPGVSYDVLRGTTEVGAFTADGAGRIAFSDAPGATTTLTYAVTRSAEQPQAGGGEGGGGGGATGLPLLALLLAAVARRRRR